MSHKQLKVKAVERPVGGACPACHRPAVLVPLTLLRCLSRPRGARVSGYSRPGPWLHPRGRRTRRPWESQPAAGHPAGPSTSLLCLAQRPSVPRTPAGETSSLLDASFFWMPRCFLSFPPLSRDCLGPLNVFWERPEPATWDPLRQMPRHGRVSREDSLTRSVPNDCHGPDGGGRDRAFRGLAEQGWNPIAARARALLEATLGCGLPRMKTGCWRDTGPG